MDVVNEDVDLIAVRRGRRGSGAMEACDWLVIGGKGKPREPLWSPTKNE